MQFAVISRVFSPPVWHSPSTAECATSRPASRSEALGLCLFREEQAMADDRSNWPARIGLVLLTGAAGFLAANQRWIDVSRWPVVGQLAVPASTQPGASREPGLVPDPIDIELPPELAEAQSEPTDEDDAEANARLMDALDVEGVQSADHEESADAPPPQARRSGYQRQVGGGVTSPEGDLPPPARVPIYPRGHRPVPESELPESDSEFSPPAGLERESSTTASPTPGRVRPRPARVQPVRGQVGESDSPEATRRAGGTSRLKSPAAVSARTVSRNSEEPLKPLAAIDALISDDDYVTAQRELSAWWFQRPDSRTQIQSRLNKLSQALYFASAPQFYEPYVVQPGDQLRQVGKRYQLTWEYLAKLNRTQPSRIRAGQKLKVVPGPFGVVASLSRFELTLHLSGSYVKHYRIGIGKEGSSPVGTFTVKNKQVDPTYYGPDGVVAADDPENPLGERWIDIGDSFGIHGTNEPDSIGKAESRGCLRLKHDDIVELYDFLVIGSEVRIEE